MTLKALLATCLAFIFGFFVAMSIQGLLDGMKRSWAKRTAADCRTISTAIEQYRADNGRYPPLDGDIEHLAPYLARVMFDSYRRATCQTSRFSW